MAETAPSDALRHINFRGLHVPRAPAPRPRRRPLPAGAAALCGELAATSDPFVAWLLNRGGLDASAYRAQPMTRRLPACLRALRVASPEAGRRKLEGQPELVRVALATLLLGVTEFFRDPPVFSSLRELLEPLARERGPLRIWSASCSTGCELFSVGLILAQLGRLAGCRLLGTDCRAEALDHARRARYLETDLKQVPEPVLQECFEPDHGWLRVREPLRSQPEWRQQDLLRDAAAESWDVVLWRNTAIYMTHGAAQETWRRLASGLRPGGLLVTGKAERPELGHPMQRVSGCIYRRLGE